MEVGGQFYDRAVYPRIRNYRYPLDRAWKGPRDAQDVLKSEKWIALAKNRTPDHPSLSLEAIIKHCV
jgi:hypothetical protein